MNRRQFTALLATGLSSPALPFTVNAQAQSLATSSSGLGVSAASCGILLRNSRKPGDHRKISDPVGFLEYCHESFQASGVQIGVGGWGENDLSRRLRERAGELEMYLEGQVALPKDKTDVGRFETQILQAKAAGVSILRTVMLSGRRYETFKTRADWDAFRKTSLESLHLAEPIMRRHAMLLAVENHKDWRIEEMMKVLESISSEFVGVNLDTGNNIALLEDAMEVVEALAPFAISTHLKDMDLEPHPSGFRLAEVPLGTGRLDIPRIMETCRKVNPAVRFNLEMITRDPLIIPCLEEAYWTTFDKVLATDLARILRSVRDDSSTPLPQVSPLSLGQQIDREHENNVQSFAWFRANRQ